MKRRVWMIESRYKARMTSKWEFEDFKESESAANHEATRLQQMSDMWEYRVRAYVPEREEK